jgi:phosphohistidine swiveling domain-containing protein
LTHGNELIAYARKNQLLDVSTYSNTELVDLYKEMYQKSINFLPYMYSLHLFDEFLTERFESRLKEYIKDKKLPEKSYYDYHIALTLPFKKISVLEDKEAFLKIAIQVKKGLDMEGKEVEEMLKHHTLMYGWIGGFHLEKEPYTFEHYKEQLKEFVASDVDKEYDQMKKDEDHLKKEQVKYMEIIKDQEELSILAKTIQVFGYVRSFRVDTSYMTLAIHWNLLSEIGKRLDMDPLLVKYLSCKEVESSLLEGKEYKTLIQERKQGMISIQIDDQHYEISDRATMEEIKGLISVSNEIDSNLVEGNVAFPGMYEGTARVLQHIDDMKKVEPGDVLIISMTDPNYIPAMEKAGAFVTDMGGILCHAAIVAREMKKPCIIATKNATSVFKDGDKVIVDAEKGEVRKV